MLLHAVCNNLHLFNLKPDQLKIFQTEHPELLDIIPDRSFIRGYEELKNQEGKTLNYSLQLQAQPLEAADAAELQRLLAVTRNMVFSNKSLKDIRQDLDELKHSSNDSVRGLYATHKEFQKTCYEKIIELQLGGHSREYILEELKDLQTVNERHAAEVNRYVHANASNNEDNDASISIQLNTNWEIKQALTTMVAAVEISLVPDPLHTPAEFFPNIATNE